MKNTITKSESRLQAFLFAAIIVIFIITMSSCSSKKAEDTKEVAQEHNDAKFDNATEKDAQFLVSAAEINLAEIQLGQIAQKSGMMTAVKNLGKMMEQGHTKALTDLEALAGKKQITVPMSLTDEGKEAARKLEDKTGKDFDKAYCDMMVTGHKDAISKFEKASTDATDPEIREWALGMLPALRSHLDESITCQKKCEKM